MCFFIYCATVLVLSLHVPSLYLVYLIHHCAIPTISDHCVLCVVVISLFVSGVPGRAHSDGGDPSCLTQQATVSGFTVS